MSLFGTSPDESATRRTKASLFDDGMTSQKKTGGGLFSDDTPDAGDSPWNFTPKKQAKSNQVKTLLSSADVPDVYVDAYDALIESGEQAGAGVSLQGVSSILKGTGLNADEQAHILRLVTQGAPVSSFQRGEFNVLLALIGLAQEEEEVSLDSVDDRRRRLPLPTLPQLHRKAIDSTVAARNTSTRASSSPTQARTAAASSLSHPEQDPWATSPNQTKSHTFARSSGANGSSMHQTVTESHRTTSSFTTSAEETSSTQGSAQQSSQTTTSGAGWGFTSNISTGFRDSGLGSGFGGDGGDEGDGDVPNQPPRQPRPPRVISSSSDEVLTVATLPDKEGSFMFQYRNYEISSSRRNVKVIRRYSDFVWLLDCLHKRYPFRQLPLLPPKRVAINGRHIATDASFIEKRRRGLSRFVNNLIKHPVLKEEQLVTMFLTVPTELASWRKQATITVQEEFVGKALPPTLEDSLPPTLEDLFATVRSGVQRSAESYINLCAHLERIIKRQALLAMDFSRFSSNLAATTEYSQDTYKFDANDVPLLNEGINSTAKHIQQHNSLLDDESRALDEITLEDFKQQRDMLVSMRDMFDRRDRYAKDNIPQLERRIASNENKLAGVRAKPEDTRKPGEAEKLEEAIMRDKESIVNQHARSVFIKECVRDEIQYWQSSQYHVGRMHQEFSQELVKYSELQADNWKSLTDLVDSMPVGES